MSDETTEKRRPGRPRGSGRGAGRNPRTASLTGGREPMLALPGVDGRELWPRQANRTYSAIVAHCGGPETITEIEQITARRVSVMEAELRHLEMRFAALRSEGKAPTITDLDLYGRLANSQHRLNTALGIERRAKDITPSLSEYLSIRATVESAAYDATTDAITNASPASLGRQDEPEQLSWVDPASDHDPAHDGPPEPQHGAAYD